MRPVQKDYVAPRSIGVHSQMLLHEVPAGQVASVTTNLHTHDEAATRAPKSNIRDWLRTPAEAKSHTEHETLSLLVPLWLPGCREQRSTTHPLTIEVAWPRCIFYPEACHLLADPAWRFNIFVCFLPPGAFWPPAGRRAPGELAEWEGWQSGGPPCCMLHVDAEFSPASTF